MVGNTCITFLRFCGFWSVADNIMYKLQFFYILESNDQQPL